jgi:AraC family transcriptional regulator
LLASETRNRLLADSIQTTVRIMPPQVTAEPSSMSGRRFTGAGVAAESVTVRPEVQLAGHDHPSVHICCVIGGSFDERAARGRRRCARGSVRLSPAGDRHDIQFGRGGAQCVLLFIDDDDVGGLNGCHERVFYESESACVAATRLSGWLRRGEPADLFSIENATWELVAQLDRSRERPGSRPVPPWLRRVRDRLCSCPAVIPSIDSLARAEGVSREHLARAFRSHFHTAPADFLRRVRLDQARRRLLEGDDPIAAIAAECGFADQSHLTRVCQSELQVTPGALRRGSGRNITSIQDFPVGPAQNRIR